MVPNKELQALANALKNTEEYGKMMDQRRSLMNRYRQQMMSFEREHTRIRRMNLKGEEVEARLKTLYLQYKNFLEKEEVKSFTESAGDYQKLVGECVAYLNRLLDVTLY